MTAYRSVFSLAVLLAFPGRAQEAPRARLSEADANAIVERALLFIPAVAASFDGGVIKGERIRVLMRPQMRARLMAKMVVPPAQLLSWARALAESELDHELLLQQAAGAGYKPDLPAARLQLEKRRDAMGEELYRETMAMQGVPEATVVRKLAETGAVNRWIAEQVGPSIALDETDAKAYFKKHRKEFALPRSRQLWHILVAKRPKAPKSRQRLLRRNAVEMRQRIAEGMSFQSVAKLGSDCPSAMNNGNLGLVSEDRLNKELRSAARKLKMGEISGIIESRAGYHLLMAGAGAPGRKLGFGEVKEQIMKQLQGETAAQAMERVKQRAHEAAHARVHIAAGKE